MEKVLNRLNDLADEIIGNSSRLSSINVRQVREFNRLVHIIEEVTNNYELMEYEDKVIFLSIKYGVEFNKDDFNIDDMLEFKEECRELKVNPLDVIMYIN